MSSGLATRCPACGTTFRVVTDQLRVSEGWVRCGRCAEVFDATRSLTDIDTGAPRQFEPAAMVRVSSAPAWPPASPAPASAPTPQAPEPQAEPGPAAPVDEPPPLPDFSARDEPAMASPPATASAVTEIGADPRAEPEDRPSFVVKAERAERWRRPGVRAALLGCCLLGLLGLAAQVVYVYRDLAAARFPQARPVLVNACAALGCRIEAARVIDSLAVESSGLVRVERSNLYRLQVALRNRAGIEVALPALDLTLTDSQGRVVSRKVVGASELGAEQASLAAGREIALQGTLQATAINGGPPPEPIVGYTIELFYP